MFTLSTIEFTISFVSMYLSSNNNNNNITLLFTVLLVNYCYVEKIMVYFTAQLILYLHCNMHTILNI